jgi:hypothetical protein
VLGAMARNALEVAALAPPWLPQDTTTLTLYGAEEEEARPGEGPPSSGLWAQQRWAG